MATNKIYDTLLYAMNKRYKGRVISTNRKEKDTIILKSILKMNDTTEKIGIYICINCIYNEENNNMI